MEQQPIVAAVAIVCRGSEVLLVKRKNEPDAGLWGFPGGRVELGETCHQCATRELLEETGVAASALDIIRTIDVIRTSSSNVVEHHFVLVAVLCQYITGEPTAYDDVGQARWVPIADVGNESTSLDVQSTLTLALAHAQ